MTAADRATALLTVAAGIFAACALMRCAFPWQALSAACLGFACTATRVWSWTRSRSLPALRLERCEDGTLQVRRGDLGPVPVRIGARTRLLGPSVFLDLTFAFTRRTERRCCWITPLDTPAEARRRWSVILPGAGQRASW